MTDQRSDASSDAVIREALDVIDRALGKMVQREIVSSGEVADLLLDVRSLLTDSGQPGLPAPEPIEVTPTEPV